MRKKLKLALMASPVIATFLSITTPYVQAEPGARSAATVITPTTDDSGRKIYVNDSIQIMPSKRTPAALGRRSSLAYWSATEHRWKTVRQLKVTNPFDPEQNVDAGVRHLKMLMENYGGDVSLSLAAYNAGAGAVARSAGVPHFAETRNYVKRITQLYYGDTRDGRSLGSPVRAPVRVKRDDRGVLYISNTD